jgi:uncharacterized RDD family membrane protein YckC
MKRPDSQLEEPALFDLPLHEPADAEARRSPPPRRRAAESPVPQPLSLFAEAAGAEGVEDAPPARPSPPSAPAPPSLAAARLGPRPLPPPTAVPRVGFGPRLAAGLADLAVHAAVAVLLVAGSRALGVPGTPPWPPLALCLTLFSFVYFVVPLAFWGNTPGMAWRGLQARSRGGEPLSFGQATRRWLGALATAALLGLPALAAWWKGRSLADLVSGSTVRGDL